MCVCELKCVGLVDVSETHTDACADRGGNGVEKETRNKWRNQFRHKRKLIEWEGGRRVSEGHRCVSGGRGRRTGVRGKCGETPVHCHLHLKIRFFNI